MDNQTLNSFVGVIGVVIALIVPITIYYLQKKKKILVYEEIQNLSVVNIKKDLKDKLDIKYSGKSVENLFVSTATLKNKGTLSIKKNEIFRPIEIIFHRKILDCSVIDVNPKGIEITLNTNSEDNSIQCEFNLLNPRDYFTLQFVSLEKLSTPTIISRIEGLTRVDILSSINQQNGSVKERRIKWFFIIFYPPIFVAIIKLHDSIYPHRELLPYDLFLILLIPILFLLMFVFHRSE